MEVSWRAPAIPNGVITHYTVYAVPQISHEETRNKRNTATTPKTIKKVIPIGSLISLNLPISTILKHFFVQAFPSTSTAGNISLTVHSITYQFQVSASVNFGQTSNEGDRSPFSPNTAIFVPRAGIQTSILINLVDSRTRDHTNELTTSS